MNENDCLTLRPIAYMESDFPTKFGIPRQSGLVDTLQSKIVFLPEFRQKDAFRGLDGFSHLWLLWGFSEARRSHWSATVRPPRLGGNTRVGVFATRSPFRPNPVGLSAVQLIQLEEAEGVVTGIWVSGADLMHGTPIYDIKPYIPYTDSRPNALSGFAAEVRENRLTIDFPNQLLLLIPAEKRSALQAVLEEDPRPSYQEDPSRIYGFFFSDFEIKFYVQKELLTVCSVEKVQ
ncbi:MAG: tRNA (N6-threonylcarbamoyladenosine(37)-N6)-methyltransferase TrmO [Eubacteriales bacterium]|nr:tRNA (N6-threonylcarbamoyladenosine(37)-N6)-methyltransferase TrmO [Eubacteriales bacterium]